MPVSPLNDSTGQVTVTVTCDGTKTSDKVQLYSLDVRHAANRIPSAIITMVDGDMEKDEFPVSDGAEFKPGAKIVISAGYAGTEQVIFTGIVIKHAIRIDNDNEAMLVVECRDKALAMTVGRKNANYVNKSDSDIISALLGKHGLSATVGSTNVTWKELVQYNVSDWDYMMARAEANGLLVTVEAGAVSAKVPDGTTEPVLMVTYGIDMIDFEAELDAQSQLPQVTSTSWDLASQAVITQVAQPVPMGTPGDDSDCTPDTLAQVVGPADYGLQTAATVDTNALTAWSKAQQTKAALSRVRGRVSFQGNASAKPGAMLQLVGVGKRFSGNVFISKVTQSVKDGVWVSHVEFGMSSNWFSEDHQLHAADAAGLTAGIQGLHVGVVKKLDADPEGQYKIQVSVPLMQAETDGVWARLASFYGSSGFGAFIIPEVGDEVVLGFFNNDPSNPVILGSLYSSTRTPAYELEAANNFKALVTRSKLKLEFDDDKKIITLLTPGNNKIVISDDAKSILLQDQNSNKVELSPSGILLDSPKDITINAKGKVAITAVMNVEVTAQADVKVTGLNINQSANIGFAAKGAATAELSAAGQTTVKGALVMIN
ncbi:type VI secretion system tip protein VgrG [Duganella sp. FT80W]|uniref:Type VI secretion system tip protein VgrG n=1 Tax=Duganella guangzhouensis TaxID=2666084 RepID=A0A6I2KXI6_9BURK|nr:type VI secretion system tip protein VgrG [Duganella guangzhouensis]MRW89717.1 type VI secretion system tip protein VgrG [Duganella guangzhouensis]